MSRPAITVENLSKAYRIGVQTKRADSLVGALQNVAAAPFRNWNSLRKLNTYGDHGDADDLHWALRDVSFEVPEGEVLGVIGRNGAGKSTLLKILSRITEPTRGRATIRGRVSSLLEVGTGFHPELSGRENIYLNGTILGMRKREIDRKLDQIIDFSGVEKFLDTPIKRYSSGMKVRLAFAVAAHLEPEILIIDEVLAVGDAEFQKKCLGKMHDVALGGRTVLFVTHNMSAVESLCTSALELRHGKLEYVGAVREALQRYRADVHASRVDDPSEIFSNARHIKGAEFIDQRGLPTTYFCLGDDFRVRIRIETDEPIISPVIGVGIDTVDGQRMLTCLTPLSDQAIPTLYGITEIDCCINELPLPPGEYAIKIAITSGCVELEAIEEACTFSISDSDAFDAGRGYHRGLVVARSHWSVV